MRRWLTASIIVLALVGVLVFLLVGRAREQRELRMLALRRQAERTALVARADAIVSEMPDGVERVTRHADIVHDARDQSRRSRAFVARDRALLAAAPVSTAAPAAPKVKPAAKADAAPKRQEKKRTVGSRDATPSGIMSREQLERMRGDKSPVKQAPPPAPKTPKKRRAPASDTPAGIMTREQLDRMHGREPADSGKDAPPAQAADEDTRQPVAPPPPPPPPPPAAPVVRTAAVVATALGEAGKKGRLLLVYAPQILADARAALQSLPTGVATAELAALVKALEQMLDDLAGCEGEMKLCLTEIAGLSGELDAFTMREAHSRNDEKAAVLRQQQAGAEETRIAEELVRFEAFRKQNLKRLSDHAYTALAGLAAQEAPRCQTDAGREAFQAAELRYRKLQWLKEYISSKINAAPLRWGWGEGRAGEDVIAASTEGIQTPRGKIPWAEVSPRQFLKWGQHYVAESPLPGRIYGDLYLSLAVLQYEHGATSAVRRLLSDAISEWPRSEDEAERLLPGL